MEIVPKPPATHHHVVRSDSIGGVEAASHFPSVVGDVCVTTGRWMYEVTLLTCGVQQLGWTTLDCEYTYNHGVGDSVGEMVKILLKVSSFITPFSFLFTRLLCL